MPRYGGTGRGRAIAQVRVSIPRRLDAAAREALERYAEVTGESVSHAKKGVGERIKDANDDILD